MVNEEKESALKKLFAAFGRKPFKQQIDVYKEWADGCSPDVVKNVVTQSINNEERLPAISKLLTLSKSLSPEINNYSITGINACWFCADTGFIPYLYEPNDTTSVWHIRMMGCRCSIGQVKSVPKYFDRYEKLQFEEETRQHSFMNHYQMVTYIMNQRNKEMKHDSNNGLKIQSAVKKEDI